MNSKALVSCSSELFTHSMVALLNESCLFSEVTGVSAIREIKQIAAWPKIKYLFIDLDARENELLLMLAHISAIRPKLKIIAFTSRHDNYLRLTIELLGGAAIISKRSGIACIKECLTSINKGQFYNGIIHSRKKQFQKTNYPENKLTAKDRDMIVYIKSGKTIAEMAALLQQSIFETLLQRNELFKKIDTREMSYQAL